MANTIDDKINSYLLANPQLKTLPRETIISVMVETGELSEAEAKKISAFAGTAKVKDDKGIAVEHAEQSQTVPAIQPKVDFTQPEAENFSMDMIAKNALNAEQLLEDIHNGFITQGYEEIKNFFKTDLSRDNVRDIIDYENSSTSYLKRAQSGTLTKRDYIKENKGRISDMLLERLERKDEETGTDFIDRNRGGLSREDYTKILQKEIEKEINRIRNIEDLKSIQLGITALTAEQEEKYLKRLSAQAIANNAEKPMDMASAVNIDLMPLEETVPADELMDFRTTFKCERGTEYSPKYMEDLAQSKGELDFATGAYNKTQVLKNKVKEMEDNYAAATKVYMSADGIATGGQEPSAAKRAQEAAEFFTDYYKSAPENAQSDLAEIIKKQKLDIKLDTDEKGNLSINFGELYKTDLEKNRALNTLLKVSVQNQEKRLNTLLNGKTYQQYITDYQTDYKNALGERNATAMAEAFKEDQLTVIDNTTGLVSFGGMGVMAIGGLLTLTPAAPAGLYMIGTGGKIALSGRAAHHVLGFSDE